MTHVPATVAMAVRLAEGLQSGRSVWTEFGILTDFEFESVAALDGPKRRSSIVYRPIQIVMHSLKSFNAMVV